MTFMLLVKVKVRLTLHLVTESKQCAAHIAFWVISPTFTRRRVKVTVKETGVSRETGCDNNVRVSDWQNCLEWQQQRESHHRAVGREAKD